MLEALGLTYDQDMFKVDLLSVGRRRHKVVRRRLCPGAASRNGDREDDQTEYKDQRISSDSQGISVLGFVSALRKNHLCEWASPARCGRGSILWSSVEKFLCVSPAGDFRPKRVYRSTPKRRKLKRAQSAGEQSIRLGLNRPS